MPQKTLDWLALWDEFRETIKAGNTSLGKNQILDLMNSLERKMVRKAQQQDTEIFHKKGDI